MPKAVKFTFSVPSQGLISDFKRECRRRGHTYSWVLTAALRYYVTHPYANGWGTGGEASATKKKVSEHLDRSS